MKKFMLSLGSEKNNALILKWAMIVSTIIFVSVEAVILRAIFNK